MTASARRKASAMLHRHGAPRCDDGRAFRASIGILLPLPRLVLRSERKAQAQRLRHVRRRSAGIAAGEKRTQIDGDVVIVEPVELDARDFAVRLNPRPHDQHEACRVRLARTLRHVILKQASAFVVGRKSFLEALLQSLAEFSPGRGRGDCSPVINALRGR